MPRLRSTLAVTALFLAFAAVPSHGATLYSTGFENPPFTPGLLAGQDGWGVFGTSTAVTVQGAIAASGSQAVMVDGALVAGQTGPFHSDPTADPLILLSADVRLASSTTQRAWQFAGLGPGLVGFAGGITIRADGTIVLITPGFPTLASTFTRDEFHHIDLLLDFATQQYDLTLDGSLAASDVPFCGSNAGCTGAVVATYGTAIFDTFGTGGNDAGFIDNFSVSSVAAVPEPATVLLLGLGAGVLVLARKIRR